jgi:hypothetical protein
MFDSCQTVIKVVSTNIEIALNFFAYMNYFFTYPEFKHILT